MAFHTRPQIALAQVRATLDAGIALAMMPADSAYGVDTAFRDGVTELGPAYAVRMQSSTSLSPLGTEPLPKALG